MCCTYSCTHRYLHLGPDHVQVYWKHKCFGNISLLETGPFIGWPASSTNQRPGLQLTYVSKTLMLPKDLHMIRPQILHEMSFPGFFRIRDVSLNLFIGSRYMSRDIRWDAPLKEKFFGIYFFLKWYVIKNRIESLKVQSLKKHGFIQK